MNLIRHLRAAVLVAASLPPLIAAAHAADATYPRGIRIGLAPLEGLAPAKSFVGFESADGEVKVLMTELPPAAYGEVEAAFKAQPEGVGGIKPQSLETASGKAYYTVESGKDGDTPVRRYSMIVSGGAFSGYVAVQVAEKRSAAVTDDKVREMFGTVTTRKDVPVDEQLALMPFKITELANFKMVRTLAPGSALLLGDADSEAKIETAPFMVLGLIGSAPDKSDERARFAQQAAAQVPGLRDARITLSEPVRIDGAQGFETRIEAVSGADKTPVTVVQWLRFGGGSVAVRVIASAPREGWSSAFPRFRAVRDGIRMR
ncbi:hypothetical protein BJ122_11478 [Rhodopseudomonas faecalis]|uniref:Uncharacterized protein n=1 Tax=Rhodopseudomonas faecalis TaxID=99655 RepID=A0A318TAL5_9BRAD|nr:hypothetical protein [Rhodopseudomonas faecalis]PYF02162.1 hypothetical protein BJ122_11478 [Rhodopseudomonas faecalis]TAH67042.1 MAG: hypothetical protein EWM45_08895 [Rhodopseudomonas palustris]